MGVYPQGRGAGEGAPRPHACEESGTARTGGREGSDVYFEHIYDADLAQGSYLIGCQETGRAVVVDPRRDVDGYLRRAASQGLRIVAVTETHVHADYLSGTRELAQRTGADTWLSDEGGDDWRYRMEGRPLRDGSEIALGKVRLLALHTPGHTPEHLSFLVTDLAAGAEPMMLLSGDFVFVGDVGRPDLLDEVAGFEDTRRQGARDLFASLRDRFLALPDHLQVWPGHGAGSACGKSLGSVPATTVGYERRLAWWASFLEQGDGQGFSDALLAGQPDVPSYFGRMKRMNLDGPPLLGERGPVPELDPSDTLPRLRERQILLLDTRPTAAREGDAIAGAVHVPDGERFATYASFAIDPDRDRRDLVLLAADADRARLLRDKLARVGIDRVSGYLTHADGFDRDSIRTVTPAQLERLEDALVLDVRTASEYEQGHIPGARQMHVSQVRWRLDEVPRERPVVTHCQKGERASVAASVLRAHGFDNVVELQGSYAAWQEHEGRGRPA